MNKSTSNATKQATKRASHPGNVTPIQQPDPSQEVVRTPMEEAEILVLAKPGNKGGKPRERIDLTIGELIERTLDCAEETLAEGLLESLARSIAFHRMALDSSTVLPNGEDPDLHLFELEQRAYYGVELARRISDARSRRAKGG